MICLKLISLSIYSTIPDFEDPLICDGCSMCCNILGGCHTTNAPLLDIDSLTFERFLWIILGSITVLLILCTTIKCLVYNPYFSPSRNIPITREKIMQDKMSAFETIGKDSVYCFFLTKNFLGWFIALAVISFQFYVFLFFVWAAEKGAYFCFHCYSNERSAKHTYTTNRLFRRQK